MRRLFSQSDWLRFAKAANQTGSFRGIGFVWSSGADPRSATRPPVEFGRVSGPSAVPSLRRTPRNSRKNSQLQKNWLRSAKYPGRPSDQERNRQLHGIGFVWRHRRAAKRRQADGGVGRGPGGPPSKNLRLRHRFWRRPVLALQPLLEALQVKVNHGGDVQGQELAHHQAAYYGEAQRLPRVGAFPVAQRDG